MRHARIIGFISVKGGVGKTTLVSNLGWILAKEFDKKVLVVDGNFSGPTLALHFGFTKPKHTLHDVLSKKISVQNAIYEHSTGMHLLPSALISKGVNLSRFGEYLNSLRKFYDVILVDSSPALNEEMLATITSSDELFVVTTPDYVTLASTLHAVKAAKEKRTYISGLVLNKMRGKRFELSMEDMQNSTHVPVVSVLHDDSKLLEALAKSVPLSAYTNNNTVVEYKKLAAALIGERYEDKRITNRVRNLFSKKLSQDDVNRAIVMVSHY